MKHDLLAHWRYFCRCVEDRPQRDPIFGSVWAVEWGVGVVQGGLRPGKVVKDSLSAFVTVCDSSEAEVLR